VQWPGLINFAIPNSNGIRRCYAGGSTSLMPWATSVSPLARADKDLAGHIHSLGSNGAQRPFPTEGKGGSCCNLATDVMSACCRRLGNSAPKNGLTCATFADKA
jgi:hypothetical protein